MKVIAVSQFRRRRGFAVIMAISLIILVGAALVVLSAGVVAEVKKTRSEAVEAQLRQLLIAGAAAARDAARTPDGKPISLPMPPDLAAEGAALKLTVTKAGEKLNVAVEAQFARRHARQTLVLSRQGDQWILTDAHLD